MINCKKCHNHIKNKKELFLPQLYTFLPVFNVQHYHKKCYKNSKRIAPIFALKENFSITDQIKYYRLSSTIFLIIFILMDLIILTYIYKQNNFALYWYIDFLLILAFGILTFGSISDFSKINRIKKLP